MRRWLRSRSTRSGKRWSTAGPPVCRRAAELALRQHESALCRPRCSRCWCSRPWRAIVVRRRQHSRISGAHVRRSRYLVIRMRSSRSASEMACEASLQPVPFMRYLYRAPICCVQFVRQLCCPCDIFNSQATCLHRSPNSIAGDGRINLDSVVRTQSGCPSSDPSPTSAGHLGGDCLSVVPGPAPACFDTAKGSRYERHRSRRLVCTPG